MHSAMKINYLFYMPFSHPEAPNLKLLPVMSHLNLVPMMCKHSGQSRNVKLTSTKGNGILSRIFYLVVFEQLRSLLLVSRC